MTIEGDYALFAHLETVYLGSLARRTLVMRNVREVVEAARGKPIFYFPARHDHWLVQTGDGWAAHVAGAIGVSTDAQASWWGGRGIGTVPHGLIAAYDGDTVLAARKFADRYAERDERDGARRLRQRLDRDRDRGRRRPRRPAVGRPAGHQRHARRHARCGRRWATSGPPASTSASCARSAPRSTTPATGACGSSCPAASRSTASGVRGRGRPGRRLRRGLVAHPRRQRLHGRRRQVNGRPVVQGRALARPNPASRSST